MKRTRNNSVLAPLTTGVRAARMAIGRWLMAGITGAELKRWATQARGGTESVEQPAAQNTWVYVGVRVIAQTIGSLPCYLTRGEDSSDPIKRGPAFDLMIWPGAKLSCNDALESMAGHLAEGGEAHVILARGERSGMPRGLNIVGRRQMEPVRDQTTGEPVFWRYTPGGGRPVAVDPELHAYTRTFNPYDDWRGLAGVEAASLAIQQDYSAALFNRSALLNGAAPGAVYTTPDKLNAEERAEYMAVIRDRHQGALNANRPMLLWGGMGYQAAAFSNVDLALYDGRKLNREEIFSAMGIPAVLAFVFDSAHYQIGPAALKVFMFHTVKPIAEKLRAMFNRFILPQVEPGVVLKFNYWGTHVMQEVFGGLIDSMSKAVSSGVPYNRAKDMLGLPLEDQAWGERSFIPSTLTTPELVTEGPALLPFNPSQDARYRLASRVARPRRRLGLAPPKQVKAITVSSIRDPEKEPLPHEIAADLRALARRAVEARRLG